MKIEEEKSLQYVHVGLDIDKLKIEICVINNGGEIIQTFQVLNTRSGFHQLIEKLMNYDNVLFGMESTGPYSGNINQFLRNINAEVVLSNPFQVARLRDVFSKSVKTDIIDSFVIAQALRMRVLSDSHKDDQYMFLQDLLERYYDLVERRVALSNQLRSNLIETFPEIDACFTQIYSRAALSILGEVQTAGELLKIGETKIKKIIRLGKGRMANKQLISLIDSCQEKTGWKTSDCHKIIIKSQVEELKFLNKQLEELQEALDNFSTQFEEELTLLNSVPGISKQISYLFLAVVGDYQRFDPKGDGKGAKRLSSYLGFGLKEYSSGSRSHKLGISKRGNSKLRGLLYMAALTAIRCDGTLKSGYEKYRDRCGSGKKGVVALSHRLLRRCYGVLKSGQLYDPRVPIGQAS